MANGLDIQDSVRVNQAIGVIAERINGTIPAATALIAERADSSGQTVDELAEAVINRTIQLGR